MIRLRWNIGAIDLMPSVERITQPQAEKVLHTEEGQFADAKSTDISPSKLTQTIAAFANSDGGELLIEISESGQGPPKIRTRCFELRCSNY